MSIVLVSNVHKPTLRALAYARASIPDRLEALTVAVDHDEALALEDQWQRLGIDVSHKVLDSPYCEVTRPVVDCVRSLTSDDDLAGEATRISNRLRGLMTRIHPHLERALGPRIQHPAVLMVLERFGSRPRPARPDADG